MSRQLIAITNNRLLLASSIQKAKSAVPPIYTHQQSPCLASDWAYVHPPR